MKILHTVEFYSPSVGGAQEVVKQISERLATRGHEVTVATSKLPDRKQSVINGVRIEEFAISGNAVRGFQGETERYQSFLKQGRFDVMMNYAAQQWTTDLVYPILGEIPYKKILIPCGFSGLYWPDFVNYFRDLPVILRNYDHLIFHADDYRDTNFARQNNLIHWSIIPNGASLTEFESGDSTFRQRFHIPSDIPLLITVGSHTGVKGHALVIEAFRRLKVEQAALVIIGNVFGKGNWWHNFFHPLLFSIKRGIFPREGDNQRYFSRAAKILLGGNAPPGCLSSCRVQSSLVNLQNSHKEVFILDLPRADVVAAYHAADLFLFGSNIEYSPIVLFEAIASRTPFISLACGNAAEIAAWSGGGIIAPTIQKDQGFVDGDPSVFAFLVDELLTDPSRHHLLAETGHKAWLERFTWEKIALDYEALYKKLLLEK